MNQKLKQIYNEDIAERNNKNLNKQINKRDNHRRIKVEKLLKEEKDLEAIDYHRAALIFQHSANLVDIKKAYKFAKNAVEMGDISARWLTAAALDRSLLMEGKAQKYGTQLKLNDEGIWELAQPIDPTVTDEDREKWNVPPLKDVLSNFRKKHSL
jgi:hypothetical protein